MRHHINFMRQISMRKISMRPPSSKEVCFVYVFASSDMLYSYTILNFGIDNDAMSTPRRRHFYPCLELVYRRIL